MKNKIILSFLFISNFCLGQNPKNYIYFKYLPFHTKDGVEFEEQFLKMKINSKLGMKEGVYYNSETFSKIKSILNKIITGHKIKYDPKVNPIDNISISDYAVRMLIAVSYKNYFIIQDKKHILFEGTFYKISEKERTNLFKLLKCQCN